MDSVSGAEEGYVYILGVADINLPVSKIGRTARDPFARCAEINRSSTGDFIWEVTHHLAVNDCRKFESLVHAKLLPFRQRRREFFNLHPDDAIVAVQSILTGSADLREITIEQTETVSAVSKGKVRAGKKLEGSGKERAYAHLLEGFTRELNVKGRPFGQLNKPEFGISDGCEGVQWNLKVFPNEGRARLGVNLEGLAYRDWPIASLIQSELAVPTLLDRVAAGKDAQNISLRFARDAWQGPSRPEIAEKLLGGKEFHLAELTNEIWLNVLTEALGCLDADRDYLGRSRQTVSVLKKDGLEPELKSMTVSPHLTISTALDPATDSPEDLKAAIERLRPFHDWARKASKS